MKFYLGITDINWYRYLSQNNPEDINFWQPGGKSNFKVLKPGAPFLFKLKHPLNKIGGVGFFASHTFLTVSMAWEIFGNRNGVPNYLDFLNIIRQLRNKENTLDLNPHIGCIVLTNPIFFNEQDWIDLPPDWAKSTQTGKSYITEETIGNQLWQKVEDILAKYSFNNQDDGKKSQLILEEPPSPTYGNSILTKVRLGQGAFRVLVTNAYSRRCAISGEKTLPVLESAHIKAFAESGPNFISNGLLLRSDLHKLFDKGYITLTPDLKIEVSRRIKEEYENGKEYYKFHGNPLTVLPTKKIDHPSLMYIEWHNSRYKG